MPTNSAAWTPLIYVQRAGITERTIFGAIQARGRANLEFGGDPTLFGRSLMKPFQMKAVARELDFELSWEQKAISLASHSGTATHVQVAQSLLSPLEQKSLALPTSSSLGGGSEKSQWFHPCSGKHAAILKACKISGWPLDHYLDEFHPYGQACRKEIENILRIELSQRVVAPDGCGLPTYSVQLSELATLFLRLAEDRKQDWIWEAFQRHPELIGGAGRLDTALIQTSPDVLAKEGADGLLGLSFVGQDPADCLGIVIKLAHGYDLPMLWEIAQRIFEALKLEAPMATPMDGQQVMATFEMEKFLVQLGSSGRTKNLFVQNKGTKGQDGGK